MRVPFEAAAEFIACAVVGVAFPAVVGCAEVVVAAAVVVVEAAAEVVLFDAWDTVEEPTVEIGTLPIVEPADEEATPKTAGLSPLFGAKKSAFTSGAPGFGSKTFP